ncbi:MAG TPA: hypothetical protein VFX98_08715 [Longimicrobiaceae bacterium]|nr:hypothetical protein [Longimicrobiaceae bacterium]
MLESIFNWTAGHAVAMKPSDWLLLKKPTLRRLTYVAEVIKLHELTQPVTGFWLKWATDFVVYYYSKTCPKNSPDVKVCRGYPLDKDEVTEREQWEDTEKFLEDLPD